MYANKRVCLRQQISKLQLLSKKCIVMNICPEYVTKYASRNHKIRMCTFSKVVL